MRARQGMALLETIVAMTIFTIAGLSAAMWARETSAGVERARNAAGAIREAGDYLDRIALWPREDLDRHLGARRQGAWVVSVERSAPSLYLVAVRDTVDGHVLVRTVLYRNEP